MTRLDNRLIITSLLTSWFLTTCIERISNIVFYAGAGWYVIPDSTLSIDSTGSRARINTLVPQTGPVRRTVAVDHTLWPTGDVGVSEVLRDALTSSSISLSVADSVGAAGRGVTGVNILHLGGH